MKLFLQLVFSILCIDQTTSSRYRIPVHETCSISDFRESRSLKLLRSSTWVQVGWLATPFSSVCKI